ncbi:unnamed protein product [Didymodactylos carnosus]|uniref:Uncharacterized protein n=1 Tax=Didymodactylos carnosus TaxID=1234261 RepID=A0A814UJY9_9BILA|nr:unnamed protein product [Didymodactylos carnosus]CAF3940762.1 unnamed protein product [Didymodactylos carnosus]
MEKSAKPEETGSELQRVFILYLQIERYSGRSITAEDYPIIIYVPSKASISFNLRLKQKKALEIMQIHFMMEEMGPTVLLNEQQTARYEELRQSKNSLITELYQSMKNVHDV